MHDKVFEPLEESTVIKSKRLRLLFQLQEIKSLKDNLFFFTVRKELNKLKINNFSCTNKKKEVTRQTINLKSGKKGKYNHS